MVKLNTIISMPRMRAIMEKCMARSRQPSEEGEAHLEELFHIANAALVHHKQDDVVVRLDDDIVMRNQHLLTAHDGTDAAAFRQVDLLNHAADHSRAARIAVGNCLDGFRRTAT